MKAPRVFYLVVFFSLQVFLLFSENEKDKILCFSDAKERLSSNAFLPDEIKNFMSFYPDLEYSVFYDIELNDWKIDMKADLYFERTNKPKGKKTATFYWAGGRLLPKEELTNKEKYWVLQYKYENELRDPKSYTQEEIERIKEFGSAENRKNSDGTPMFFFDFLYSAQSQKIIEEHIIKSTFLGKSTRVHERIYDRLKIVEKKFLKKRMSRKSKNFLTT